MKVRHRSLLIVCIAGLLAVLLWVAWYLSPQQAINREYGIKIPFSSSVVFKEGIDGMFGGWSEYIFRLPKTAAISDEIFCREIGLMYEKYPKYEMVVPPKRFFPENGALLCWLYIDGTMGDKINIYSSRDYLYIYIVYQ